jgi:hypothetical protein
MFNRCSGQLVKKLLDDSAINIPTGQWGVLEFGNQRFDAPGIAPGAPSTVREFYLALGFQSYVAVDTNTEKDAVIGDLNFPLTRQEGEAFKNRYALVTNIGTGEHVFNQASVFQNAHDMCQVGGVMLHQLPCSPWVNHGFFNYNPILFRDLALANGYEVIYFALSDRWARNVVWLSCDDAWLFKEKRPVELERALRKAWSTSVWGIAKRQSDVFICAAYRKTTDAEFRFPLQGKYFKDIDHTELRARYT